MLKFTTEPESEPVASHDSASWLARPIATTLVALTRDNKLFVIGQRASHIRCSNGRANELGNTWDSWEYFIPTDEVPLLQEGIERNIFGVTHEKRLGEWTLLAWRRRTDASVALAAKPLNGWSRQLEVLLLAPTATRPS